MIVLNPDTTNKLLFFTTNKLLSHRQGPAVVIGIISPDSYLIELNQGQRRWLHANKLRPYHVRVNEVIANNSAIVYDRYEEFGAETNHCSDCLPSLAQG